MVWKSSPVSQEQHHFSVDGGSYIYIYRESERERETHLVDYTHTHTHYPPFSIWAHSHHNTRPALFRPDSMTINHWAPCPPSVSLPLSLFLCLCLCLFLSDDQLTIYFWYKHHATIWSYPLCFYTSFEVRNKLVKLKFWLDCVGVLLESASAAKTYQRVRDGDLAPFDAFLFY